MPGKTSFDVIILGGSYAGLSAAMALGRSMRSVLIIDSGQPCNSQTPHSHNFITQDGEPPHRIAAKAKEQVLNYNTITWLDGLAVSANPSEGGFAVTTLSGEVFQGQKLILATGIKDIMPDIPGFAECWGITAVHCPYCHGYELRNQKTAILADGFKAMHLAALVNNLSSDLTILTCSKPDFTKDHWSKLKRHNITVIETPVTAFQHENGLIQNLIFQDGSIMPFTAVYAALPFKQHAELVSSLGCQLTDHGHLEIDPFQQTSIEGVYACGDNCNQMRSVANAVYSGNLTGAMVNRALTEENF
jgi:thioredoxin reductase